MREPRIPFAERQRDAREVAVRKRQASIRLGTTGIVLLFGGAIGIVLRPEAVGLLLIAMSGGLVLVAIALVVIRSASASGSWFRELPKML